MTRKRFVKMLMADGRTRNEANFNALIARTHGYSYDDAFDMIEHCGTLYSPSQIEQSVRCLANAISAVFPAIIETCKSMVNTFAEFAKGVSNILQNSDE